MPRHLTRTLSAIAATAAAMLAAVPAAADGMPEEPLARFEEPVCPGVVGLQLEPAQAMVARVRANAARLSVPLADEDGCVPNLVITFLPDGQDYLRRLNDRRGYLFDTMPRADKRRLLETEGPARAWITSEVRTRDGMFVGQRDNLVDLPQAGMWSAHSLIYVPTRRDITAAMVLIDRDAVEGRSIAQLADYATLHGLAEFVPAAAEGVPTIQHLFAGEGAAAPDGLTAFDAAYLERLYSSIPNLPAYARLAGLEGLAE